MNAELNEPKPGMSTSKKWMIGCGGCLGLSLLAVILTVWLGSLGFNALKEASNNSVKNIFGAHYQPDAAHYQAMGLPLKQDKLNNLVMLINTDRKFTIVALDINVEPSELQILKSGKPEQLENYFKKTSADIAASTKASSSKIEGITFTSVQQLPFTNNKKLPLARGVVQTRQKTQTEYSPAVIALVPEAEQHLVILIASNLDRDKMSANANTDFSEAQKVLQNDILNLIKDSDLEDRLK